MTEPYLVIFDCDGTLVDSEAMITAALTAAFQSCAIAPPPRAAMHGIVGLTLINAMRQLAPAESPDMQERLADAYKAAFWEFRDSKLHEEPLFPGARAVLDDLHADERVLLGIATGKSRRGVDRLIETHGLEGRFVTIQTCDSAPSKPDPAMILQAIAEAGADPARTVMIGDSTFDLDMARNASVAAIGVSWGFMARDRLAGSAPASLIDSFAELPEALRRLWPEFAR